MKAHLLYTWIIAGKSFSVSKPGVFEALATFESTGVGALSMGDGEPIPDDFDRFDDYEAAFMDWLKAELPRIRQIH